MVEISLPGMNKTNIIILAISVFGLMARPAMAQSVPTAESSAKPNFPVEIADARVSKLKAYLESHGSPLASEAEHFIAEADRLGLDWKLVAAISGVESTFGKHIPQNSYNCWGWGIFTGASDGIHFASWKDGITTVSEGLKHNYVDKGASSVEQIGRIYAASPTWSTKVRFFLQRIEEYSPSGIDHLAVTI